MRLLLLGLFSSLALLAQGAGPVVNVQVDPSGSCGFPQNLQFNMANQKLWGCGTDATWHTISGGGGGGGTPGGSSGNVQVNNAGAFGGITLTAGDIPVADATLGLKNSHLDDGVTTASTVTSSEAFAALSVNSTGTGGAFEYFTQGAAPASPAGCGFSTTWCLFAPTSVTSGGEVIQSAGPAQGTKIASFASGSTTVIQDSISGDSNHAVKATTQTGAISTATLCAATQGTACGQIGQYRISYNFWGSGTACANVTLGSVGLNFTWNDENLQAHTTVSAPIFDLKSSAYGTAFNFNTALTTEGASGEFIISTNGTIIQYATTYTACTSGTGTYNLRLTVEPLQ